MNVFRKSRGYTLVEIVVVISIMAALTAIVYSSFDTSKAQSRDQKRVSDVSTLQLALEQYFQKNGVYPLQLSTLVPTYIPEIPTDPTNVYVNQYFPMTKTSGANSHCISYQLWTRFELSNGYLNSKKGFNSTAETLPNGLYECTNGVDFHIKINASTESLVYDVTP